MEETVKKSLPKGLAEGPVSFGTEKLEDIVPKALGVLRWLDAALANQYEADWNEVFTREPEGELPGEFFEDLCKAIDERLPPGYWFGTAEGDGACWGIWYDDSRGDPAQAG